MPSATTGTISRPRFFAGAGAAFTGFDFDDADAFGRASTKAPPSSEESFMIAKGKIN